MKKRSVAVIVGVVLLVIVSVMARYSNYSLSGLERLVQHDVVAPVQSTVAVDLPKPADPTPSVDAFTAFVDSFENQLNDHWYREMQPTPYSGAVSNLYAKAGTSSYRIELRKSDALLSGGKRSGILLRDPEKPLLESTYSFSILLPKGGEEDYALDPKGSELIAQWVNTPDRGEAGTTPPLALRTMNGGYVLERCWDDEAITSNDQMTRKTNRASYNLGPYEGDQGKFVTWSFHVKWGWLEAQKPVMEIYKDGVKVLNLINLPNTMNDKIGVYMKLGIYKWDWAQDDAHNWSILNKRVIYYAM